MVITIVQIPRSGPKPDKATSIEGAMKSAPLYCEVKGLIRKDFLNGEECGDVDECFEECQCEECIQIGIDRMESMNDID